MKLPRTPVFLLLFLTLGLNTGSSCARPVNSHSAVPSALEQSLKKFVHQHISAQIRGWADDTHPPKPQVRIDLTHLHNSLRDKPACLEPEFFLPDNVLRPHVSVVLRCRKHNTSVRWTVYVPVKLRIMGQYPVAARPLAPNHTIGKQDIRLRTGDLLRLPPNTVIHPENVLKYATTQRIAAHQAFKHNTLRSAHTVRRGQPLTLKIRGAAYTISSTGTALQAGEVGNRLLARNAAGQIVQGHLVDIHTLVINDASTEDKEHAEAQAVEHIPAA